MEMSDCGKRILSSKTALRSLRPMLINASLAACCTIFFTLNVSAQQGRRGGRVRGDAPPASTPRDAAPPASTPPGGIPSAPTQTDETTPPPPAAPTPRRQGATPRAQRGQQPQNRTISQDETFTDTASIETGQTREYTMNAREGETLIVSVTSSNFNPAIEIVGASGSAVAQNDDVRAGEQDAVLLTRLANAGAYRVRVRASTQTTGGQTRAGEYELTVRRFVPTQAETGGRVTGTLGRSLKQWHRFQADAGQTLAVAVRSSVFNPTVEIYAPNGEAVVPDPIDTGAGEGAGRSIFRSAQAGTYYARVAPATEGQANANQASSNYTLTIAPVRTSTLNIGTANSSRRLETGGLDLYTFEGAANEIIRVQATAPSPGVSVRIVPVPTGDVGAIPEAATAPEGQNRTRATRPPSSSSEITSIASVTALPVSPKATGEAVAMLSAAGTYQVVVLQPTGLPVEYTLTSSRPLSTFRDGGESTGTLALGGSDFWAIGGGATGIARLEGMSEQFDVRLELYSPNGSLVGANDDGAGGRNAGLTYLRNDPGRYILRVHSVGDGGSGAYHLRRGANPARGLRLGERTEGTMPPDGTEIYSFEGRAGQSVIITVRSTEFDPKVALHGPDGAELGNDDDGGGGTDSLLTRRLPANGTYTVWVTPFSGSGQFTLRVIED